LLCTRGLADIGEEDHSRLAFANNTALPAEELGRPAERPRKQLQE
jgi:hypothetical protein